MEKVWLAVMSLCVGLVSCLGTTTSNDCDQHECSRIGLRRCAGNNIEHCGFTRTGCRVWHLEFDCGQRGERCVEEDNDRASCGFSDTANNDTGCRECEEDNDPFCTAEGIQACVDDGECSRYETVEVCERPTDCRFIPGLGVGCFPECEGECEAGQRICDGTVLRLCKRGEDGCLSFEEEGLDCATLATPEVVDVPLDPADGERLAPVCVEGDLVGCQCTPQCPERGQRRCTAAGVETCDRVGQGDDSCRAWLLFDPCPEGTRCTGFEDANEVHCQPPCPGDGCPFFGALRCEGDILQTCAGDDNMCLDWEEAADCEARGERCEETDEGLRCVP